MAITKLQIKDHPWSNIPLKKFFSLPLNLSVEKTFPIGHDHRLIPMMLNMKGVQYIFLNLVISDFYHIFSITDNIINVLEEVMFSLQ